jgi:membrane protease YdiL (CAAX protease family)
MKPESNFSRVFIDLAKIGRTDWRSVALTILLVQFLLLISGIPVFSLIFVAHRLFHISDADKTVVFDVADAAARTFGLWLACKKILRRPFRSLISTDMTFDIRRCLLGAALYLAANAISLMAISLFFSMRAGAWLVPFGHFEWPHHNDQIVVSMGMLIVIPFLAFSEELFFRAWLTQALGHYIRSTIIVVALVAALFAAGHSQYDLRMKMLIVVDSFGFSALSLRDRRLELAIGAHSMMNICVTLQLLFFAGPLPHAQVPATTLDTWTIIVLKGALPCALMYGLLEKTRGWFASTDGSLTSPGNVHPRHLGS